MFKVGQKVWDILRGPGIVVAVSDKDTSINPVTVQFAYPHGVINYTRGCSTGGGFRRSLFFSEPKIDAATEPVWSPKLKSGDRVLVKMKSSDNLYSLVVFKETEDIVLSKTNGKYSKLEYEFYKIGEKIIV